MGTRLDERAQIASIVAWFCAVGGTILASTIMPFVVHT